MKFKVIQSNPSNEGKTFVTKLQAETTIDHPIFGIKSKKETYYISGSKQLEVGAEVPVNLNEWRIHEYPFVNESTGEEVMLKWLHLK